MQAGAYKYFRRKHHRLAGFEIGSATEHFLDSVWHKVSNANDDRKLNLKRQQNQLTNYDDGSYVFPVCVFCSRHARSGSSERGDRSIVLNQALGRNSVGRNSPSRVCRLLRHGQCRHVGRRQFGQGRLWTRNVQRQRFDLCETYRRSIR